MQKIILALFYSVFLSLAFMPKAPHAEDMPATRPLIAIVIDDAGVDVRRTARAVVNLKAPVTLSYLAYGPNIQKQVTEARKYGHEVMLHLPWEPDSGRADAGPHHLSVEMTPTQLQHHLLANLDGFTGYTGVNNHMGSKFSHDRAGLDIVMTELKKRGVYFLDSRTTPHSLAETVAREHQIPATHRDVFLDNAETGEFLTAALRETEEAALKNGSAIAIGHPKDMTLAALEAWLPAVEAKGFQLVSITTLLQYRQSANVENVAKK
jgi:polysaccharide deacetylase 2 family uncharacterized protein YibQ